jgi:hypothetical protein
MHPDDVHAHVIGHAQPGRVGQSVRAHLARQRADHDAAGAQGQVLARGVQQAVVFGVAQVLQVGRAVAVVRVARQHAHHGAAVVAVQRVLVQQAKRLATAAQVRLLHQRGDGAARQCGLAGAGVAAEEDESRHSTSIPAAGIDIESSGLLSPGTTVQDMQGGVSRILKPVIARVNPSSHANAAGVTARVAARVATGCAACRAAARSGIRQGRAGPPSPSGEIPGMTVRRACPAKTSYLA